MIKSDQKLWRIQIQGVWWKIGVVVVCGWDLGRLKCDPLFLNLKLMWIKRFLKLNVFPTKWKTTCCFFESTGWKLFDLVNLTIKPNQSVVSWFQLIVSLKILIEFCFEWWICFKWFLTEYAPSLNVLTNLWKI